MGCLEQILKHERVIIGIRDYKDCVIPESRLWINELPGITLKSAASVANMEMQTGAAVLQQSIDSAVKDVFDDFSQQVSPHFDFNLVLETREVDLFSETTTLPATADSRGLSLRRWRSELSRIYIEEIYIKSNTTGTGEVKIYDGATLVKTISDIALVAGAKQAIRVDLMCEEENVKVLMDDTALSVYTCDVNNWNYDNQETCLPCSSRNRGQQGYFITGWDGMHEQNKCYGIGIKSSVRCYESNIICSVLPRMYFIIWYKSGINFLKERIYSDRVNPITLFTKEKAVELLTEYEAEYQNKYKSFQKSIFQFINSTKGECLTCNGNKYAQFTP